MEPTRLIRANQVQAIHESLRHVLPGEWHQHTIWSPGPTSVHQFYANGILCSFDVRSLGDRYQILVGPRERSQIDEFNAVIAKNPDVFPEPVSSSGRILLHEGSFQDGIATSGVSESIGATIASYRRFIERPDDPNTPSLTAVFDHARFGEVHVLTGDRLADKLAKISGDGVYRVGSEEQPLDLLITGYGNLPRSNYFVAGLNALVSGRASLTGPFFTGMGIAHRSGMTVVSIADPALQLNKTVPLAWYAGYRGRTDLTPQIADVLDTLSSLWGKRTFFVGGSGGGFASLNIARHMATASRGIVVNSQTSIARYTPPHVSSYLSAALGVPVRVRNSAEAEPRLQLLGVPYDVTDGNWADHEFLIAYNADDWHVQAHLDPLLQNGRVESVSDRVRIDEARGFAAYTRKWGDGHARLPDRNLLANLLRDYGPDLTPVQLADALDRLLDEALASTRR